MQRGRKLIDPALQWSGCLSPETHNMKMIGFFLFALAAAMPKNSFAQFTPPKPFMAPPKTPQDYMDYNPQYEMRKMEAQQRSGQDQQRRDMEFQRGWHQEVWIPPYTNDEDAGQGIEVHLTDFKAGMAMSTNEVKEDSSSVVISNKDRDDLSKALEAEKKRAQQLRDQEDVEEKSKINGEVFIRQLFDGRTHSQVRGVWWDDDGFFSYALNEPNYNGNSIFFQLLDGGPLHSSVSRYGIEWLVCEGVVTPAEAMTYLMKLLAKTHDSKLSLEIYMSMQKTGIKEYSVSVVYRALAAIHPYLKDETWLEPSLSILLTQLPGQNAEIPIKQGDRLADIVTTILSKMKQKKL